MPLATLARVNKANPLGVRMQSVHISLPVWRRVALALIVSIAAMIPFFALSGDASAGTYLKGRTCKLIGDRPYSMDPDCTLYFTTAGNPTYQCYARMSKTSSISYPYYRAAVYLHVPGAWTTGSHAYSPLSTCQGYTQTWAISGMQSAAAGVSRTYNLQLYSGSY